MRLKLKHITLSLSLLTLAVACKEEELTFVQEEGKTPIELSVGGIGGQESATTRAVYTTKTPDKKFTAGTSIFMLMKSEYVALTGDFASYNYGGTQDAKYATTSGTVKDDADGINIEFHNDATTTRTRYWDDAHGRSSRLSIWAVACDGLTKLGGIGTELDESSNIFNTKDSKQPWGTTEITATELAWNVPHYSMSTGGEDETSIKNRDLLFSNNVTKYTENSTEYDKRTKYETTNKQFGNSELTFYHALSKITVKLTMGNGFTGTNDFRFTGTTTNKNITLTYFNIWGKFNVAEGEWKAVNNPPHQAITYMYNVTGDTPNTTDNTKPAYQLEALVIPYLTGDKKTPYQGSQFTKDNNTVMMEFSIDNNTYKLTADQLYTAFHGKTNVKEDNNQILLEQGKNYELTLTIGKTKIDNISAQLVDWQTITAEATPDNAHSLTVTMETTAGDKDKDPVASYLYKSAVSSATKDGNNKGYSNDTRFTLSATKTTQDTGWYWESNSTYYHFRTIAPKEDLTKDGDSEANYITMKGGAITSTADYVWGAPLEEKHGTSPANHAIPYDMAKGYEGYLYPAIGPTKSPIHITQFHMMSDLEINLTTNNGADAVTLTDNVSITLKSYANTANLMVGTGLIKDWSIIDGPTSLTQENTPSDGYSKTFTWRVIPQALKRGDNATVGICITTTDGNIYEIKDLSTLPVTITGSSNTTIPTWEPGKKYIYNLTLKKTGIDHITATVVNWVNVEATNENIQIQ